MIFNIVRLLLSKTHIRLSRFFAVLYRSMSEHFGRDRSARLVPVPTEFAEIARNAVSKEINFSFVLVTLIRLGEKRTFMCENDFYGLVLFKRVNGYMWHNNL